jgi:hypothetical protein
LEDDEALEAARQLLEEHSSVPASV